MEELLIDGRVSSLCMCLCVGGGGADTLVHQQHDGIVVGSTSSYVIIAYLHIFFYILVIINLYVKIGLQFSKFVCTLTKKLQLGFFKLET